MDYYSRILWVEEYVKNVAAYIYVRKEDSLLIKIPNQAFKLNPQAVKVLSYLLEGGSVLGIIDKYVDKEAIAGDIHNFFCDLRAILKGCYHESEFRKAIVKIPFALGFNSLPILSEIAITYRCNLACKFCYASCGCKKQERAEELSAQSLKEILRIIKNEAEVPSVSFTGGEPTLRRDLPELINYAKSLKMWANLITNATLIDSALAVNLKAAGLDSAQVSLEAGAAGLHDSIAGKPGAFNLTIEGLKNLKEAGIRVHTNTTISRLNKEHLAGILELVKDLGLDKFSMNMLMPCGDALSNLEDILIKYEEIGGIILAVNNYAKELGLEFMWYSPTPVCIFNPIVHGLGNKGCAACDGLLSIAANGDILPCSSYPQPVGNILKAKGRFKETWRGKGFSFFQKKEFAHSHCQSCAQLAVCNGGCPLYWQEVGYEELLKRGTSVVCKEVMV